MPKRARRRRLLALAEASSIRAARPSIRKSPAKRPKSSVASSAAPRSSRIRPSAAAAGPWRGSSSSAWRSEDSSPASTSRSAFDGTSVSRNCSIWAGGIAPVNWPTTWPSRNAFTAGIPRMSKLRASSWFASVSTFASSTSPSRFRIASSSAGPSWRHGPHHSAQKSTTTGSSRERSTTSVVNVASVTSLIIAFEVTEGLRCARGGGGAAE